jgi:hypothetical protein
MQTEEKAKFCAGLGNEGDSAFLAAIPVGPPLNRRTLSSGGLGNEKYDGIELRFLNLRACRNSQFKQGDVRRRSMTRVSAMPIQPAALHSFFS